MEYFFTVRTVSEAREILFSSWKVPTPDKEVVSLLDATGRILAEDVTSAEDIPPFSRSTVDGYAVIAEDTFGASSALPAILEVVEDIPMGAVPTKPIRRGQASRIATGGMIPQGSNACVMLEHTEPLDDSSILVQAPVAPGENIVVKGEDVRSGERILSAGHLIRHCDVGALAAVGLTSVAVFKRPQVAIISTGNEVVPPDEKPGPGQIRDINSYSLASRVKELGATPKLMGIVPDRYQTLMEKVEEALSGSDMVVISGGSSVGTRDLSLRVIEDLGPPGVLVHGVNIRPGKPVILGLCRSKPVFGLPGHPVSCLVTFELFVKPAIRALSGLDTGRYGLAQDRWERYTGLTARLSRHVASAPGREDHIRVRLRESGGELWADPVLGKSSLISTMVHADGEMVIPAELEGLAQGTPVPVRLLSSC